MKILKNGRLINCKDTETMRRIKNGSLINCKDIDMFAELYSNRVRFNNGYHDGAFNSISNIKRFDGLTISDIADKHFDRIYALGYIAGVKDVQNNRYHSNSTAAWSKSRIKDGCEDHRLIKKN